MTRPSLPGYATRMVWVISAFFILEDTSLHLVTRGRRSCDCSCEPEQVRIELPHRSLAFQTSSGGEAAASYLANNKLHLPPSRGLGGNRVQQRQLGSATRPLPAARRT